MYFTDILFVWNFKKRFQGSIYQLILLSVHQIVKHALKILQHFLIWEHWEEIVSGKKFLGTGL